MQLDGKVVIVTGAARGIGQEYARACASAGAKVVATDINDCGQTLDSVKTAGGNAIAVKVNVSDIQATNAMVAAALEAYGRVDGLINNAALYGTLRGGKFDAISEADWDATMAVNVKGIWNCCKSAVPAMRRTGGGSIVNITLARRNLRPGLRDPLYDLEGRGYWPDARPRPRNSAATTSASTRLRRAPF